MSKKILILAEILDVNSSSAGKACNALIKSLAAEDFNIKAYHYSHKEININNVQTILIKEDRKDIYYFLSRTQRVFQRLTKKNISKKLEKRFGFSFTFKNDVNSMVESMERENPSDYDLVITLSKGASYRTTLFKGETTFPLLKFKNAYEDQFIDALADKNGYYRLSTVGTYAYHMGTAVDEDTNLLKQRMGDRISQQAFKELNISINKRVSPYWLRSFAFRVLKKILKL